MKSVRELVNDLWSEFEINKLPSRRRTLGFWNDAVGSNLSSLCAVEGFSEATVIVRAFNPAAAMELRYRSREILTTLNKSAGTELFQLMRIVVRRPGT